MARRVLSRAAAVSALVAMMATGVGAMQEFGVGPDFTVPRNERVVLGEVVVKFKRAPAGGMADLPGTTSPEALSEDTFVFKLDTAGPLEGEAGTAALNEFLAQVRAREDVDYAEPNFWAYPMATPNDAFYPDMWHYHPRGSGAGQAPGGVDMPAAWDASTGNPSIVVAVIDTGILPNHPEFTGGNLLDGFDMISHPQIENDGTPGRDDDETDPGDAVAAGECYPGSDARADSWHGSHVAGTVGAGRTNDGTGIAGISWQGRVLPVRVLGKCGGTTADIAAGIRWAAGLAVPGTRPNTTPARVLNLSLGGPGACTNTYRNAIADAIAAGATVVVAAGNETDNAGNYRPASCPDAITVGAVDYRSHLARYSNFGASVDVMAPGGDVQRDDNGDGFDDGVLSAVQGGYSFYNGTSMATPHVAGVISLWLAQNPGLTPAQIATSVTTNVHPLGAGQNCGGNRCGAGLIRAHLPGLAPAPAPGPAPTPSPPPATCGLLGIEVLLVPLAGWLVRRRRGARV